MWNSAGSLLGLAVTGAMTCKSGEPIPVPVRKRQADPVSHLTRTSGKRYAFTRHTNINCEPLTVVDILRLAWAKVSILRTGREQLSQCVLIGKIYGDSPHVADASAAGTARPVLGVIKALWSPRSARWPAKTKLPDKYMNQAGRSQPTWASPTGCARALAGMEMKATMQRRRAQYQAI